MNELTILMPTVGESCTIPSLVQLKNRTHKHDLMIVYSPYNENTDFAFYTELVTYSDDVVLTTKSHGIVGAINFGMAGCSSEFFATVPADALVSENWWPRMKDVFDYDPKIAIVGGSPSLKVGEFVVNDREPDDIVVWRMKAVVDVGGILCAFKQYGSEVNEWTRRARKKGWNYAAIGGICENKPLELNEGRRLVNRPDYLDYDCRVLLKAEAMKYEGYSWWQKELA
jgi:hypothetical protein